MLPREIIIAQIRNVSMPLLLAAEVAAIVTAVAVKRKRKRTKSVKFSVLRLCKTPSGRE